MGLEVAICFLWTVDTTGQMVYALPWMGLVAVPILGLFLLILRVYVTTSRQLRRLQSVTRSPIYSSFQETLQVHHLCHLRQLIDVGDLFEGLLVHPCLQS